MDEDLKVNSFQVPNALVDKYITKLSGIATKCYLYILRKTKGWDKTDDQISKSQFMDFLQIKDDRTLKKALQEIIDINVIEQIKQPGKPHTYKLISDIKPLAKNVGGAKNVLSTKNGYAKNDTPSKKCTPQYIIEEKEEDNIKKYIKKLSSDTLELDHEVGLFVEYLNFQKKKQPQNPMMYQKKIKQNLLNFDNQTLDNYKDFLDEKDYFIHLKQGVR